MKELINLIELSKHNKDLAGMLCEGLVDEFIEENGEIEFRDRFHVSGILRYNVVFQSGFVNWNSQFHRRKLKRGQRKRRFRFSRPYFFRKESKEVGQFKLNNMKGDRLIKIISTTPLAVGAKHEFKLKNFRLQYWIYPKSTTCKIQVKYKQSNTSNELFKRAFNNAEYYPRKNSYVDLISFNTSNPRADQLLLYLHQIFKNVK